MADELGKHGQRDRFRVNLAEAPELGAWCEEFGCTPDQLKIAVGRAGVMATEVQAYLERQGWNNRAATPARSVEPRRFLKMWPLRPRRGSRT